MNGVELVEQLIRVIALIDEEGIDNIDNYDYYRLRKLVEWLTDLGIMPVGMIVPHQYARPSEDDLEQLRETARERKNT